MTIALVIVAVVVASARTLSQTDGPLQLQARVVGQGTPVVLLGGGLLGADGWGQVPQVLARTRRVFNLQSLAVQYRLGRSRPANRLLDSHRGRCVTPHFGVAGPGGRRHYRNVPRRGDRHHLWARTIRDGCRTLTLIEPPALWMLPNHGRDDKGAREMQELVSSLRGGPVGEEHVERFRCLLGDCAGGRSARQLAPMAAVGEVSEFAPRSLPCRRLQR